MKFSIVVCTIGNRKGELIRLLESLAFQTYVNFEIIVVSQLNHGDVNDILKKYPQLSIKHIKSDRLGLSFNRNIGLNYANGDIVTFSDDDCWYPEAAFEKVKNYFSKNYFLDVIAFKIFDPISQKFYKDYPLKNYKLSLLKSGKLSSIEFFCKLKFLKNNNILFNTNFGLGAKYPSGEENLFVAHLIKNQAKIQYFPETIVFHKVMPLQKYTFDSLKMETVYNLFKNVFPTFYLFFYFIYIGKHIKKIKSIRKAICLIYKK
jgi:glycosyltransferase involved in cell wall biosynthesis